MVSAKDANLNEYRRIHMYVQARLGKPAKCSDCGKEGGNKRYHWANLSGEYKEDLTDWIRLCPKCHHKRDNWTGGRNFWLDSNGNSHNTKEVCLRGHLLSGDNLRVQKTGKQVGKRRCIACERLNSKTFRDRRNNNGIRH